MELGRRVVEPGGEMKGSAAAPTTVNVFFGDEDEEGKAADADQEPRRHPAGRERSQQSRPKSASCRIRTVVSSRKPGLRRGRSCHGRRRFGAGPGCFGEGEAPPFHDRIQAAHSPRSRSVQGLRRGWGYSQTGRPVFLKPDLEGLAKKKRGPKAKPEDPRVKELEREDARLKRRVKGPVQQVRGCLQVVLRIRGHHELPTYLRPEALTTHRKGHAVALIRLSLCRHSARLIFRLPYRPRLASQAAFTRTSRRSRSCSRSLSGRENQP